MLNISISALGNKLALFDVSYHQCYNIYGSGISQPFLYCEIFLFIVRVNSLTFQSIAVRNLA